MADDAEKRIRKGIREFLGIFYLDSFANQIELSGILQPENLRQDDLRYLYEWAKTSERKRNHTDIVGELQRCAKEMTIANIGLKIYQAARQLEIAEKEENSCCCL